MPVRDRVAMIREMAPELMPGAFFFVTTADPDRKAAARELALAAFEETEGSSFILPEEAALRLGFSAGLAMRQITLTVHSALDGIGLTAAVASALAEAGIPCNMVAAFHHDHVFVPGDRAEEALSVLRSRATESP